MGSWTVGRALTGKFYITISRGSLRNQLLFPYLIQRFPKTAMPSVYLLQIVIYFIKAALQWIRKLRQGKGRCARVYQMKCKLLLCFTVRGGSSVEPLLLVRSDGLLTFHNLFPSSLEQFNNLVYIVDAVLEVGVPL